MSTYSRDDFTAPVEDYDFQKIDDVSSLIDQMSKAGGFTATKLAHARDILRISTKKTDEGILKSNREIERDTLIPTKVPTT